MMGLRRAAHGPTLVLSGSAEEAKPNVRRKILGRGQRDEEATGYRQRA